MATTLGWAKRAIRVKTAATKVRQPQESMLRRFEPRQGTANTDWEFYLTRVSSASSMVKRSCCTSQQRLATIASSSEHSHKISHINIRSRAFFNNNALWQAFRSQRRPKRNDAPVGLETQRSRNRWRASMSPKIRPAVFPMAYQWASSRISNFRSSVCTTRTPNSPITS